MLFTPPGQAGKQIKILEKNDKSVLSPAYRIEDSLEFCDYLWPFARSVGPAVKKMRKKMENGKLTIARQKSKRLIVASQTRHNNNNNNHVPVPEDIRSIAERERDRVQEDIPVRALIFKPKAAIPKVKT